MNKSEKKDNCENNYSYENKNYYLDKILWPSCVNCGKNNELENNHCNRYCIKKYLTKRLNLNLCRHSRRDEKFNLIFPKYCDCNAFLNILKKEIKDEKLCSLNNLTT